MRTCEKLKPISDENRIKKFLKDRKLEENSSTAVLIQFKPNRQGIQIYRRVFCYAQQIIIKDVLRFHFPIIFFPHFFFDHFTTNIHISLFFLSISVSRSQTGCSETSQRCFSSDPFLCFSSSSLSFPFPQMQSDRFPTHTHKWVCDSQRRLNTQTD